MVKLSDEKPIAMKDLKYLELLNKRIKILKISEQIKKVSIE